MHQGTGARTAFLLNPILCPRGDGISPAAKRPQQDEARAPPSTGSVGSPGCRCAGPSSCPYPETERSSRLIGREERACHGKRRPLRRRRGVPCRLSLGQWFQLLARHDAPRHCLSPIAGICCVCRSRRTRAHSKRSARPAEDIIGSSG